MGSGLRIGMAVALLISVSACAQTFNATGVGVPVTMASPAGRQVEGRHFEVTSRAVFAAWGLVPLQRPSLEAVLAGQLVGADSVANVRIRVRSRWTDVLISTLTLGLIVPRAVTYEGTIVGE